MNDNNSYIPSSYSPNDPYASPPSYPAPSPPSPSSYECQQQGFSGSPNYQAPQGTPDWVSAIPAQAQHQANLRGF